MLKWPEVFTASDKLVSISAHLEHGNREVSPTSGLGFWMSNGFLLFGIEIIAWGPSIISPLPFKQD